MTKLRASLFLLLSWSGALTGATIPYPNIGTPAQSYTFTAASTGSVIAYFYATNAGATSEIGMSVNGAAPTIFSLQNHSSNYGDSEDLGAVNAGDTIVFVLRILPTFTTQWYSNAALNVDGLNHTYVTSFSGDSMIPAGTYVGFEDIEQLGDIDYNDHQFVFDNVIATPTPEPTSAILTGTGALLVCVWARRRRRL